MPMSGPYERLRRFLERDMRMSHLYQPLMLKALLSGKGERRGDRSQRPSSLSLVSCGRPRRLHRFGSTPPSVELGPESKPRLSYDVERCSARNEAKSRG